MNESYLKLLKKYEFEKGQLNSPKPDFYKSINSDYLVTTKDKDQNIVKKSFHYINELNSNPYGNVKIINYKGTQIYLCGANYTHIPFKNIYKMLLYSKPDLILTQLRPDYILKNFNINCTNPKTNKFSQRLFSNQLIRYGWEIMPSKKIRNKIYLELNKSKETKIDEEKYNELYKQGINKNYKPYNLYENLTEDIIGSISLYSEIYGKQIMLCDLPEIVFKQNIVNQMHRYQLEELMKKSVEELIFKKDITYNTPLNGCLYSNPDLILLKTDDYICSLIQYLNHKKYKKLFLFIGNSQTNSIINLLENRKNKRISESLKVPEINNIEFKEPSLEELIEKYSILDVMTYGDYLFDDFENKLFKTTYTIIEYYGDIENDSSKYNHYRHLHCQFLIKYYKLYKKMKSEAEQKLKGEYINKIIKEYNY